MNCIIIDDEPLARAEMRSLIKEVSEIKISGDFSNALTALDFLKTNDIDLIFLDIEMPLVTGLEFAEQLPKQSLIIFTTAYSQYALKSYELDAIDYLLKPIEKHRLEKAIRKAELYDQLLSQSTIKNTIESNTNDFLFIKSDRRFYKLNLDEIKFIEGLKDYVVIHTKTQKLITAMNLKTTHLKLPAEKFLRVSKSYVVNINFIDSFDNHNIYVDESEIPLGEVFRAEFFRVYSGGSLNSNL
ncbi:LytR/AlgR family response regulator transcription factor [Epilithonimonas hungarica]|jgi:Response regulator of the LytR/AlgR family|uniref:Two component transcriptional regulator, LytTR family n=1 Tax=Epilithonimonas hungarica TaxID=454006 RepID=A0A1G7RTR1_9FLAO|nr:LytTR family DNA-binding domain-containing protein [Epilithonimonas hungarica]MDP9955753.1 DNA-binding LytR/AlgR family response regulator [Epilithonimonas hungarica]SDG14158.1 two component transcriptional regulator, LytTR family [Epilithonimonas hungarica]